MKFRTLIPLFALLGTVLGPSLVAKTLEEMYDQAAPNHGYDKYIELETGVVYTGGLLIGRTFNRITSTFEGTKTLDVRIQGNGAVLDLQGGSICIAYCENRLDIEDCIIINGDVRFQGAHMGSYTGQPVGSVRYVTFYRPHDYGVRCYGCGDGILVERNIVADAVDTGPDFQFLSGYALEWLPTGASVAFSGVGYGFPRVKDNWSFHSDPAANADPLRHFLLLCEYG